MVYRTTDRFPSPSTLVKNAETTAEVEIEMYKETTELTDENLAKPFEQIQAALKAINVSSSNERN